MDVPESLVSAVWRRGLLTAAECQRLIDAPVAWAPALATTSEGKPTATGGKRAAWKLLPLADYEWVYARLARFVQDHADYGFAIEELGAPLKVQRYAPGDFHRWHVDLATGPRRKLGITVQLSEGGNYEGGALRLYNPPEHLEALRDQGAAVCFPSYLPHEVSAVRAGTRNALTGGAVGPPFR